MLLRTVNIKFKIEIKNPLINHKNMKSTIFFRTVLTVFTIGLLSLTSAAQNYDFTLIHNGDYSFTIGAVSNFDSSGFSPITQSYGFTLVVPDGVTINIDQVLPSGANETVTPIPGINVSSLDPSMSDKDLFQIIAETSGATINSHGLGEVIPLVTISLNGSPTTGELRLLANSSTLASHPVINGALDTFFQVDIIDDAIVTFTNEFGDLTEMNAFSFSTLSISNVSEDDLSVKLYPNPAKDVVYLVGNISELEQIAIYDINGKLVKTIVDHFEKISISDLDSAIYFLRLYKKSGLKVLRLLKQ